MHMKKNVLLLCLLFALMMNTYAQFNESIGTNKVQIGRSVQSVNADSGYIVAGKEEWDAITIGSSDASLVRVDPNGALMWSHLYGNTGSDWFNSVRNVNVTSGSNLPPGFAALGTSYSFSGTPDMYFVRTDLFGNPLFSYVYGKAGKDFGHCLQYIKDAETGRLGYVMLGQSDSYTYYGGTTDIFVTKIDEFGTIIQSTVMGGEGEDIGYWIEQTSDGGFILVGSTTSKTCAGIPGNKDIIVVRLDSKLKILWSSIIGHEHLATEDVAYGVVEDPTDGSFTLTGFSKSFNGREGDAYLINLNPMGALNWMQTYDTKKEDHGHSIHIARTICGELEYVVSGSTFGFSGSEDALVFKTDRTGILKWVNVYGTNRGEEQAAEITAANGTGYIFTGFAEANFTQLRDIYLVNIKEDGERSSACEFRTDLERKPQSPCLDAGLQQLYVHDIKRVSTAVKRRDYRELKCETFTTSSLDKIFGGSLEEEIVITPNPSISAINVNMRTADIRGAELQIRNRNGVTIYTSPIIEDNLTIDVKSFPNDLYVIVIISRDGKKHYGRFLKE